MNDIKSYQGYVNLDLMDHDRHPSMDNFLKIMEDLFVEGNLNNEQVFMFMRTLIRKAEDKKVRAFLETNEERSNLMQDVMDYGWITEDGEFTDHCKAKLHEMGFEGYDNV